MNSLTTLLTFMFVGPINVISVALKAHHSLENPRVVYG